MGAMQALEWGIHYPERVRSIIPIAGTGRPSPMAIALNALARQAIYNDPDVAQGQLQAGTPTDGWPGPGPRRRPYLVPLRSHR